MSPISKNQDKLVSYIALQMQVIWQTFFRTLWATPCNTGALMLIGAFLTGSCSFNANPRHLEGSAMGTVYTVTYCGNIGPDRLKLDLKEHLAGIESQLSNWHEDSWISRFNRSMETGYVPVPNHAQQVLKYYQNIIARTDSALDPTLGRLINRWGFGPPKVDHPPDPQAIREAMGSAGAEKITFMNEPPRIAKGDPDLQLNVSALTKGYAADVLACHLESEGINSYLINIGGDIRVGNHCEQYSTWKVSIQRPEPDTRSGQAYATIGINTSGLATSGDYRRFLEENGQRYPHILDPQTGMPVRTDLASVSIIAPTSMEADGLATASMVMGLHNARKMVEQMPDVEGLFIQRIKKHRFKSFTTSGWPDVKK